MTTSPMMIDAKVVNAIDLFKWAAPLMDIQDYHTIWTLVLSESQNDSYYDFDLYGFEEDGVIVDAFRDLVMKEYKLVKEDRLILWLCW